MDITTFKAEDIVYTHNPDECSGTYHHKPTGTKIHWNEGFCFIVFPDGEKSEIDPWHDERGRALAEWEEQGFGEYRAATAAEEAEHKAAMN